MVLLLFYVLLRETLSPTIIFKVLGSLETFFQEGFKWGSEAATR